MHNRMPKLTLPLRVQINECSNVIIIIKSYHQFISLSNTLVKNLDLFLDPGAPTSHAPFTIPETTPRPPPVMPPFPGFPGNQKRSLRLRKISRRSKSW